ncbi:MEDS domain-containing protein [Solirubrobacter ginsenosidimutans]|uniref:MEDS domain-containing protein n=1 Tax=Solirubrobacter ginsenosidimutans TaxID=490573 RepID=A0A9X3MSY1_9ACTN|nr:MEDS domain-containing protein [Solirubrobacter ginsenosidimutans]MDA0160625.1 MEDS domain-containing protein [Solirubrobacter ginsenosidimutans]
MSTVIDPRAVDDGQHVVQFYVRDAELVEGAGGYLSQGVFAGAVGIVIATEAHRAAFEAHLRSAGVDVAAERDVGTLVWLDAATMLARFMHEGAVDRDAFFEVVGSVVHSAAATRRPVRAYGEMVALLWDAGNVIAAIDLETLWNELGTRVPFSLYCAYRRTSVVGHEHADALKRVCHLHSAVVTAPRVETSWEFSADRAAPGRARDLLVDALRHLGHDGELLDDARLVVTELAANAVVHASSSFSVSVREEGSSVRILVGDRSPVAPAMREASVTRLSGRGMQLIAAVATRWGVVFTPDGKVVWAELSAP